MSTDFKSVDFFRQKKNDRSADKQTADFIFRDTLLGYPATTSRQLPAHIYGIFGGKKTQFDLFGRNIARIKIALQAS
jgi:hypothetical protein